MKIICIGRNYAEHAKELNNAIPTEPVIFIKPDSAVLRDNDSFYIPDFTTDVHYEAELFVRITKAGKSIPVQFAADYYSEIGLGIDFTARDVQQRLKDAGLPCEKAKGCDNSAVIGKSFSKAEVQSYPIRFSLYLNDKLVQDGNSNDMIYSIDEIISHVSQYFTLKTGDLIFTGTPKGVGSVKPGDTLKGFIGTEECFCFDVK